MGSKRWERKIGAAMRLRHTKEKAVTLLQVTTNLSGVRPTGLRVISFSNFLSTFLLRVEFLPCQVLRYPHHKVDRNHNNSRSVTAHSL